LAQPEQNPIQRLRNVSGSLNQLAKNTYTSAVCRARLGIAKPVTALYLFHILVETKYPIGQGVRQKSDVNTSGSSPLVRTALPEILKSAAEFRAAERDDGVGASDSPVHPGAF
jgi:hypothetical protein